MASSKDKKESGSPSKRRNTNELSSLLELASRRDLHHLIPAALSKSNVNTPNSFFKTPLHLALLNGCTLETLNVLKGAGADIGARDRWGFSALFFAIQGNCSNEVVNELLEYDWEMLFDERYIEVQKHTFFVALIRKRFYALMPLIVKHHRILYDQTMTTIDKTLLNLALIYDFSYEDDCPESIEPMLQVMSPASLNKTDRDGNTYLHHATKKCCRPVTIRALLKAGLNPAAVNNKGQNAMHLLIYHYLARVSMSDFYKLNRFQLVLKELLKGHLELVKGYLIYFGDTFIFPSTDDSPSHDIYFTVLKWVLLQNGPDFQWNGNKPTPTTASTRSFLRNCRSELELLQAFMVTDTLSLYDLVKSCYLSPKFVNELRVGKRFVRVLQFEGNLTVYEEEVRGIVRMVRVCSSLYGKTLPFPVLKNGDYRNMSQRVLDYLSIDDLEKLSIAVNVA